MARVSVDIQDNIARVTLTRPEKRNALDLSMIEAIVEAGQGLMGRDDVRAVVLLGEGQAFCAGLDVASFAQIAAGDPEALVMPRTHEDGNLFQEVAMIWRKVPVPVIAALHGVCYGGGFQLALGADIRVASQDLKLAIMEMKWGLIPDMGGMVLLPHLARSDVIRQMTYTAAPIDATQAGQWGIVTEIAEDAQARALELAAEIAGKSPSAIRAAKRLIGYAESGASAKDVLLAESREQTDLIGKPHQMEVIAANMARRPPKFK